MTVNSTTASMNEDSVDNSSIYENVSADSTFDNFEEEITPNPDGQGDEDDWGATEDDDSSGQVEDKLGAEELKLLNDSDGEEVEEKAVVKEEEVEEAEEIVEATEEEKLAQASEDAGKKLRIKIGDDHFSLDSNAKLKVKVDGQNEEVSVQDLINNYSGKTAWDKKFTEIGNEKKTLTQKVQEVEQREASINASLKPIFDLLKDPMKDPFEALELLVDMTGQDSYAFYKRSLETRLDELVNLSQMSDVEQKAYFLEKQNERLLKSSEKRNQSDRESQQSKQLRDQVDQIRQAYGVSVDQYSEAFDELRSLMPDAKMTHQQIVDYASIKPLSPKIEKILQPYKDEINDSDYWGVVTSLARNLRDKKFTEQEITKLVKDEYGISAPVKELNTKLNIGKNKQPQKKIEEEQSDRILSFDDLID